MKSIRSIAVALALVACPPFTLAADKDGAAEKPFRYWVEQLSSDDAAIRKAATAALLANCDAIFESPKFHDEDQLAKQITIRAELKPLFSQLQKLLESKHDDCRETAASLLAVLGPDASDAEPALLGILRSREASGEVRMAVVTALLHVTPRSRAVLPTLLEVYNAQADTEAEKRNATPDVADHEEAAAGIGGTTIAIILAQSGRGAIEVPTLVEMTAGEYRRGIRLTFIYALAEMGSECRAAVPDLLKLLSDDDRRIRSAAGWAVLCIDGDPEKLPAVLKALSLDAKEDAEFQESISRFFKEKADTVNWLRDGKDEIGQQVRQQLLRQVTFDNPVCARQAIRLLGDVGPEAKFAVPTLTTVSKSDDKTTREAALAALKRIDPSAVPPDLRGKSAYD